MKMAINDGARRGRVMVRKGIQDVYNIKSARINDPNKKKGLSVQFAQSGNLKATISAGWMPVNLVNVQGSKLEASQVGSEIAFSSRIRYNKKTGAVIPGRTTSRRIRKIYSGGGISVEIRKGSRKTISSAFTIGRFHHYKTGASVSIPGGAVFARGKKGTPAFQFGKKRMPIDSIATISVHRASVDSKAVDLFEGPVNAYTMQRFKHHVERMIKAAT